MGEENNPVADSRLSEMGKKEMELLEDRPKAKNTNRATKLGLNKFRSWLDRPSQLCNFASILVADINDLLQQFYAEVKHSKPGQSLTPVH